MATCTKKEIPQPKYTFLLELTEDEAKAMVELLQHVGGSPTESARRHTDKILASMQSCGITRIGYDAVVIDRIALRFKSGS